MSEHYWLVCHTKPRCEKKFAALMKAENFEHYLALVKSVRHYAQQTKSFTKPLFPGYVFAKIPVEQKARIYQQDLLARAITAFLASQPGVLRVGYPELAGHPERERAARLLPRGCRRRRRRRGGGGGGGC